MLIPSFPCTDSLNSCTASLISCSLGVPSIISLASLACSSFSQIIRTLYRPDYLLRWFHIPLPRDSLMVVPKLLQSCIHPSVLVPFNPSYLTYIMLYTYPQISQPNNLFSLNNDPPFIFPHVHMCFSFSSNSSVVVTSRTVRASDPEYQLILYFPPSMAQPQFTVLNDSMLDFVDDLHLAPVKLVRLIFSCRILWQRGKILESRLLANELVSLFWYIFLYKIFLVLLTES